MVPPTAGDMSASAMCMVHVSFTKKSHEGKNSSFQPFMGLIHEEMPLSACCRVLARLRTGHGLFGLSGETFMVSITVPF